MRCTVLFEVMGDEGGSWALIIDESGPRIEAGPLEKVDLILRFTEEAMQILLDGNLDARQSISTGAVTVSGNLELLRQVGTLVFGG